MTHTTSLRVTKLEDSILQDIRSFHARVGGAPRLTWGAKTRELAAQAVGVRKARHSDRGRETAREIERTLQSLLAEKRVHFSPRGWMVGARP